MTGPQVGTDLVSTDWLAERLGTAGLHVFDASFYLPTESANAADLFDQGHIPGARFFDLEAVADQETDLPHMVPSAGRFERAVSALGVSDGDCVVFYDQKGLFSAARGWWLMRLFGHQACVLDGGLPKWRAEHRATEQGQPANSKPGRFHATLRAARLRGLGDMIDNLATRRELVLDARPAGRFDGTAPEPRPGMPGGHMPGAASLPASELLAPDQTMLPPAALRARFAAAGADGTRPLVTSCGTGVTAAILTLGLAVAGLPEGALYDGSWTEWASRPDTPKETSK
jgi:thiosulfate/3-mercaptopyruvate sulfurtransferase